jgi:hypothetical protein
MAKQQIHINLNELKEIIKQQIHESYLGDYGMSGTCVFEPGWNADITEEESEELNQYMQPSYSISFNAESSGGDGYYTPDETYNVPDEGDVEAVRSDINAIPNEHLRQAISDEFNEWLENCEPDMDYNEPDPDRFKDEVYEAKVGDPEFLFKPPFHGEPGDEHFENPEQIQQDKKDAWDELSNRMTPEDPSYYNDYNNNVNGKEMKPIERFDGTKSELNYGYPGLGHYKSMAAQSDDPNDKWYGQTARGTFTDFFDASDTWFPADIDDTQYSDSTYRVGKNGEINESEIKSYLKTLIREAMEGMNGQEFVIQTRTGGYLLDIKDDSVSYDENTLVLSGLVGRSPVSIMVNKEDYQNLVNGGQSCSGQYKILNRGGDSTPENPCTLSIYKQ